MSLPILPLHLRKEPKLRKSICYWGVLIKKNIRNWKKHSIWNGGKYLFQFQKEITIKFLKKQRYHKQHDIILFSLLTATSSDQWFI